MSRLLLKIMSVLLIVSSPGLFTQALAQDKQDQHPEEIENYNEQVKRLIGFMEFSLNTLGDAEIPTREKEVIINESYLKAFRDNEVQIEDDLDENREMVTHKAVQAYLKDVDFFFRKVEFDYTIQDIQSLVNDEGELYFKVTANRSLIGITVDGDSVSNNQTRYIELNLDEDEQVLKIVSIYTTKLNLDAEMMAWWNRLSDTWKGILGDGLFINDTIPFTDIKTITDSAIVLFMDTTRLIQIDTFLVFGFDTLFIDETDTVPAQFYDTIPNLSGPAIRMLKHIMTMEELDISGNLNIHNIRPLDEMSKLQYLDISNTLAADLFPLRNVTKLRMLNISGTPVRSLMPIMYLDNLEKLLLDNTNIRSLQAAEQFEKLGLLSFNNTLVDSLDNLKRLNTIRDLRFEDSPVKDLQPITDLINLELLNCSGTRVVSLDPVKYLIKLERLYLQRTAVDELSMLSNLSELRMIYADGSNIENLKGLGGLPVLEKIYCDDTPITQTTANEFMGNNPGVLVIYESEALTKWWESLHDEWQQVFSSLVVLDTVPAKEQLHEITLIEEIDISGNQNISSLDPLIKLAGLKVLYCQGSAITSLEPLKDLIDLQELNCSNTGITDLSPLGGLKNLTKLDLSGTGITSLTGLSTVMDMNVLNIENTSIDDLMPLKDIPALEVIYCDNTAVDQASASRLQGTNPECLIVYRTPELKAWWGFLSTAWEDIFREHTTVDENPTKEQLHRVAGLREINFDNNKSALNLEPLSKLARLETLSFSDAQISSLGPVADLYRLKKLNFSNNPIEDLDPLLELSDLSTLNFQNTPVKDMKVLTGLTSLEKLDCSGTQIKKLNPLFTLYSLKELECYNTGIKSLKPLEDLPGLRLLKCYNTKLNAKKVESFEAMKPKCEMVYY